MVNSFHASSISTQMGILAICGEYILCNWDDWRNFLFHNAFL